jgi:hypothetical protein
MQKISCEVIKTEYIRESSSKLFIDVKSINAGGESIYTCYLCDYNGTRYSPNIGDIVDVYLDGNEPYCIPIEASSIDDKINPGDFICGNFDNNLYLKFNAEKKNLELVNKATDGVDSINDFEIKLAQVFDINAKQKILAFVDTVNVLLTLSNRHSFDVNAYNAIVTAFDAVRTVFTSIITFAPPAVDAVINAQNPIILAQSNIVTTNANNITADIAALNPLIS